MLNAGYNSFCIDGSSWGFDRDLLKIPFERYAIYDMSEDFIDEILHKQFEITTCIEMLEHIPKDKLRNVLDNILIYF